MQLGVKVTSPARTLLDLAPRLSQRELTRLVNDALREHNIRHDGLQDVLTRNPHHPATKLLKPFLDLPGTNPTNSHFEDDFLPFLARYGLPTPLTNVWVNGRQVDAHQLAHGIRTLRITKERLKANPDREAARLRRILDRAKPV